jgi:hypothetical protein
MNVILRDKIDQGIVFYIDNILIYAPTIDKHVLLAKKILERLYK